jgi:hypothetical protein
MRLASGVEVLELPVQSFMGRTVIQPTPLEKYKNQLSPLSKYELN